MKLAPGTPLDIALAFAPDARVPVGQLAWAQQTAQLEWSREVIAKKLSVDPLPRYPLQPGLQAARTRDFDGLHGFLADSLPEGWGHLVMRKRLRELGHDIDALTPMERLALVGDNGRGALVFSPATTPDAGLSEGLDLDALAEDAAELLTGEDGKLADVLAKAAGGSGGARPKVHVGFGPKGEISVGDSELPADHAAWIVKFKAKEDPDDIGPLEEAYACMAEAAGLKLAEHRLIPAKQGHAYFATRRFDRPSPGARVHMVSLAGAVEAPMTAGSLSYDQFLRATHAITRDAEDVARAFRHMVFNVLSHNRDDHARQHAYLMDENGVWSLSPAYDLTYAAGPGGEHYLDVEGEGRKVTHKHVETLGAKHGLDAKAVKAMVDEVSTAVGDWRTFASAAGVTALTTKLVADAHERVRAGF
ncbi:MAG: type II toxin-antitoxin system HipA family toxin [Hyphomonadaceae bacterium]|nr:type II toxin-antitoxin system HipA family toxin [Hyphomonadaceae bacterium]